MAVRTRAASIGVFWLMGLSAGPFANTLCFSRADTFYEQVYCELEAKGQVRGLPSFEQFRKNNEIVQASLLKRPAQRNRIKLPVKKSGLATGVEPASAPKDRVFEPTSTAVAATDMESGCHISGREIRCAASDILYQAIGNRANKHLAADALSVDQRMALPQPNPGQSDAEYLSGAYLRYIDKMVAIGLGGVTLTYAKFVYLYRDISARGLNFSQRFETMYGFLKQDKATMGVSEAIQIPAEMRWADCDVLPQRYITCALAGRNYVFVSRPL